VSVELNLATCTRLWTDNPSEGSPLRLVVEAYFFLFLSFPIELPLRCNAHMAHTIRKVVCPSATPSPPADSNPSPFSLNLALRRNRAPLLVFSQSHFSPLPEPPTVPVSPSPSYGREGLDFGFAPGGGNSVFPHSLSHFLSQLGPQPGYFDQTLHRQSHGPQLKRVVIPFGQGANEAPMPFRGNGWLGSFFFTFLVRMLRRGLCPLCVYDEGERLDS